MHELTLGINQQTLKVNMTTLTIPIYALVMIGLDYWKWQSVVLVHSSSSLSRYACTFRYVHACLYVCMCMRLCMYVQVLSTGIYV